MLSMNYSEIPLGTLVMGKNFSAEENIQVHVK
jgi:hypothetical protein